MTMGKVPIRISPNMLTVVRIILAQVIVYMLFIPSLAVQLCVGILFIVAVLTDFYDGYLARKTGCVTNTGKILDPLADKLLVLGMFMAFSLRGLFEWQWLVPLVIREVLVTLLRFAFLLTGKVSAAEEWGKFKVGFQIASLTAAWICLLLRDYALSHPISVMYEPLVVILYLSLCCSVVITVYSGLVFLKRNSNTIAALGIARLIGTFFYMGRAPVAPGTVGSLGALLLYLSIYHNGWAYGSIVACVLIFGTWSARHVSEERNDPDPSEVVIDEVAGLLVTFLLVPFHIVCIIVGFILFRLFDIIKPWPIHTVEKIKKGYGIMLDDIIAGVFSNVVLQIVYYQFLR